MTLIIFHIKIIQLITIYIFIKLDLKKCKIPIFFFYKDVLNKLNFNKPHYSAIYTL